MSEHNFRLLWFLHNCFPLMIQFKRFATTMDMDLKWEVELLTNPNQSEAFKHLLLTNSKSLHGLFGSSFGQNIETEYSARHPCGPGPNTNSQTPSHTNTDKMRKNSQKQKHWDWKLGWHLDSWCHHTKTLNKKETLKQLNIMPTDNGPHATFIPR